MTHIPYVCGKWRRTRRSFSTPFCMQTTGVDGGRHRQLRERMVGVLSLHGEQDDGVAVRVGLPRHCRRLGHGRDRQRRGLARRLEDEARTAGLGRAPPVPPG